MTNIQDGNFAKTIDGFQPLTINRGFKGNHSFFLISIFSINNEGLSPKVHKSTRGCLRRGIRFSDTYIYIYISVIRQTKLPVNCGNFGVT